MKTPLISIITVVYNGENTIRQTIESVLNQTYKNIEYIIVDGKSTDKTLDIIDDYKDRIAHVISEKDKGIYDAMNKGIALAKGKVIGLINADDYYENDAVEHIARHYQPGMVNYYGAMRSIDEDGKTFVSPPVQHLDKLKRGMVVSHPSLFVNNEVYEKYGVFSLDYKVAADWDFTLRCFMKGVTFIKIEKIISNFRIGGVSGALSKKHLRELSVIRKKNGAAGTVDFYYLYDSLRFFIFGKHLYRLFLLKKKITNAK
ncbi:hypothetical protein ASG31_03900 [Chryseobacterium sp. Leaf404]|uniref:glycosyltransferase family 2 protein n=1 Tax=unclassified Chryseobacterium TaxID=2593645 RepID=UPI0006F37FB1|nr:MULTISPECIES: glycosyltransferase family 2 protein [unclassified Chryseobacterium]KQT17890.1 hypothetical protein ASG31_03900 [Chryseobacterium sp. Leaf404]